MKCSLGSIVAVLVSGTLLGQQPVPARLPAVGADADRRRHAHAHAHAEPRRQHHQALEGEPLRGLPQEVHLRARTSRRTSRPRTSSGSGTRACRRISSRPSPSARRSCPSRRAGRSAPLCRPSRQLPRRLPCPRRRRPRAGKASRGATAASSSSRAAGIPASSSSRKTRSAGRTGATRRRTFSCTAKQMTEQQLTCLKKSGGNECFEWVVKSKGQEYRFRDIAWEQGENAKVAGDLRVLQVALPEPRLLAGAGRREVGAK